MHSLVEIKIKKNTHNYILPVVLYEHERKKVPAGACERVPQQNIETNQVGSKRILEELLQKDLKT